MAVRGLGSLVLSRQTQYHSTWEGLDSEVGILVTVVLGHSIESEAMNRFDRGGP